MTERKFTPFEDNGIQEYVTRDGREAKVCVVTCESSLERNLVIRGFVRNSDGVWCTSTWGVKGHHINYTKKGVHLHYMDYDLFDVTVKHTRWVNVYPDSYVSYLTEGAYPTKEDANRYAGKSRVACIEVTFEEGEGL
jgi:hypothetical protein